MAFGMLKQACQTPSRAFPTPPAGSPKKVGDFPYLFGAPQGPTEGYKGGPFWGGGKRGRGGPTHKRWPLGRFGQLRHLPQGAQIVQGADSPRAWLSE